MSVSKNKKILILDDEQNILNALKRLLRLETFDVDVTTSQKEALDLLKKNYAVIISDFNMPGMNGVDFLTEAKKISENTFRIILTGYADLNTTLSAINKSSVYKFLLKPWDNHELVQIVKDAVNLYNLSAENERLNKLVEEQNEKLKDINANLEIKVKERTAEISKLSKEIEQAYLGTVRMMSSLVEASSGVIGGHSKRVALWTGTIAKAVGISGKELLNIEVAAFLHDIGKIGLPENILKKGEENLTEGEAQVYKKHVTKGEAILNNIVGMKEVARIIREHHEHYDGTGFPDRLAGEGIHIGARIIRLIDFYDKELNSKSRAESTTIRDVLKTMQAKVGAYFDPQIFAAFANYIQTHLKQAVNDDVEIEIELTDLKIGMILSRPIILASGRQLLPKESLVKEGYVDKINRFNAVDPIIEGIFIYRRKSNPNINNEMEIEFLKGDLGDGN